MHRTPLQASLLPLLTVATLAWSGGLANGQTTWHVDPAGTVGAAGTAADPYPGIGYALSRPTTVDGDTVLVGPGTYSETFSFGGKAVAVVSSAGRELTTIDGGGNGPVVSWTSGEQADSALVGFTVTGGQGPAGAGLRCSGSSPSIIDCAVVDNNARPGAGGGAHCSAGSAPRFENCELRGNLAYQGAGIFVADSTVTLVRCTLDQNAAEHPALANQPSSTFKGGGIFASNSVLDVSDSDLTANRARCGDGGGIYLQGTTATIRDTLFGGNTVGALFVECVDPYVHGGGLYVDGSSSADVERCTFRGNAGFYGADFAFNDTQGLGGGVYGPAEVRDSLFDRNFTEGIGGASVDAQLVDCRIVGNSAVPNRDGHGGNGGGVRGGVALRCTIQDCRATGLGGGALLADLERCQVVDNRAAQGAGAWGGQLLHCSVVGNRAEYNGGGVAGTSSGVAGSIVWGNVPDQVDIGVSVSFSDVQGSHPGPGNFDLDPLFWGPESRDLQLLAGSPCIDAGDPGSPLDGDGSIADVGVLPYDASHVGGTGSYCDPKYASAGCFPSMGFSGSPTLSGADDFHIVASSVVNQKFGMLFWGPVPGAVPFAGGTRCVVGAVQRTAPRNSGGGPAQAPDCSGSLDFPFSQAYMGLHGLAPGDRRYAQFWFRDPQAADGSGIGLSDGLEFTLLP